MCISAFLNFKINSDFIIKTQSCLEMEMRAYLCQPNLKKMFNKRTRIKELLMQEPAEQQVVVMGWVRTFRNDQFIALNDGSTNTNIQVVVALGKFADELLKRITTGAAIKVTGKLIPSLGK